MHKNLTFKIFLLLLIVFSVVHCANPDHPKGNNKKAQKTQKTSPAPEPDSVSAIPDKEVKETDASKLNNIIQQIRQSKPYTSYVPASVKAGQELPVIFIFDPHARGDVPIEKYSDLADDYGIVLVASNLSENNQVIEEGMKFFKGMRKGIEQEINIDKNQMYVMGFSGGARVAVSIAIQDKDVGAAVGCGAGFPALRQLPAPDFYYFAMAGFEDFNLGELIDNDRYLARNGFDNEVMIFDGGHSWPEKEVMREAFLALQIQNIEKHGGSGDEIIAEAIAYYNKRIDGFIHENRYFDATETAGRAASVLEGVSNFMGFKSKYERFKKNPEYETELTAMVKSLRKENELQGKFINAFNTQTMDWWEREITRLRAPVTDIFEERMNKRLEGFLGLMSYMMTNKAIDEGNMVQAQKDIDIYRLLEPENSEHAYLNAIVKMRLGDEASAEGYLQQSIDLGFNDFERFNAEELFMKLKNKKSLLILMQKN